MMRETNISEIVNAARIGFKDYLFWMNFEMQMILEEILNFLQAIYQHFFFLIQKDEIIGVSDIAGDFEFVLNKLIKFVQIHIGKQLRGQIT